MELSENSPNRKRPLKAAIEKGSTASLSQLAVIGKMTVQGGKALDKRIGEFASELRRLEDRFNVSVFSKGLPYGGSTLVIRDNETKEVYDLYDLEEGKYETT